VDFIRSYADRFHHAKEEDILFACFDPGLDILKAMHEDHDRGRAHVRGVVEALEQGDREGVAAHLAGYAGVLSEHIKKEDEILYPWMDRNLSVRQVGELFARVSSRWTSGSRRNGKSTRRSSSDSRKRTQNLFRR